MKETTKIKIRDRYYRLASYDFNQWLLEFLTLDINDKERDQQRLEILRYITENGLI